MRREPDGGSASARRRDALTGAAALAAHAALLALAFAVRTSPPPPASQGADASRAEIEIDLRDTAPRETPPQPSAQPEPPASAAPRDLARSGAARETLPELPPAASPEAAPSAVASSTAAPSAAGDVWGSAPSVPMAGGDLTVGGSIWGVPGALPSGPDAGGKPSGPLAPKVAQAPGANVLRDTVRAGDRELGLGNPGATAVANAVADAVRGSNVPAETSAVLVARIGGDGVVVSVGVQQFSSGDGNKWKSVAQAATAALGKKKLGLAGLGPNGALVQVSVSSAVALPSGSKKAAEWRKPSLTEGPPRDVMPAPSPDGDSCAPERYSDLKPVCGVGAKIGVGDLADLVAKPHRQVKTTFQIKLLDDALALAVPTAAAPASAAPSAPPAPTSGADAGAP